MAKANINYKKAFLKASREPLRLLVIAFIPLLISYLTEVPYEWAGVAIVLLRWADKVVYQVGKEANSEFLTKGLTRF